MSSWNACEMRSATGAFFPSDMPCECTGNAGGVSMRGTSGRGSGSANLVPSSCTAWWTCATNGSSSSICARAQSLSLVAALPAVAVRKAEKVEARWGLSAGSGGASEGATGMS